MKRKKIAKRAMKLFDSQIDRLASLDVPACIMTDPLLFLMEFRERVVSRVIEFEDRGFSFDVWFVPVIPFNIVGVFNQAQFLQFNGNKGYSYFNHGDVYDLIPTSKRPYYLLGINENSSSSEGFIDPKRFLTLSESLALCLHENVLCKYYVKSLNSFFETVREPSIIHVYRGEHPKVDWEYFEGGQSDNFLWGASPYCLERMTWRD